ncbi:BatA domain-containing protein [Flavobacterium urocaniciphilum]|uniref:N-terminal double-transmembrane domain-containing protein n=1 Tax=Flavobacterium urocaniciphilum TaxID=1299341 RepID=A0A1H9D3D6_9FLAO|nr:BatA domain-containing protein [Flavobacterium urocaniciphilum]SEQ07867.1 N-terminal double-transmembrane domain-containing protein [Flavobacterium urocaniciphilum]
MQFKNPEILYFLFLLIIPILVHLFQLRRFKKQEFTNVKLLKELEIQTRKSSTIKKWLLLATRLLLLAALIFAFAQPFFKAKDFDKKNNELIVVIDNSFSMQAKGNSGELLKRTIQDLLENTPEEQQLSVLTNDENFYDTNIRNIQKELQNLKYSSTPFNPAAIITRIEAKKPGLPKDILFISDAVGLKDELKTNLSDASSLYYQTVEANETNNIAIENVQISQVLDQFYELKISIKSYGDFENDVPISMYNGKKLVGKALISKEKPQKEILFTIPKNDFHGYVTIQDNSLSYDNTFYFSISKPQKSNVIAVGNTDKNQFLSRIYNAEEFNYTSTELNTLNYNSIENADAIILNEVSNIPNALSVTLKNYYSKGGNIIFIPDVNSPVDSYNSFLRNFSNNSLSEKVVKEKQITQISFNHPIYTNVFEKKVSNFQYPKTNATFTINGSNLPVLQYEDKSVFLGNITNRLGNLFFFSTSINKENSNFQNSPLIVPTFYNMGQNNNKTGLNAFTIGNNNFTIINETIAKDNVLSVTNAENSFIPMQQILNNKIKLTFGNYPENSGNYAVLKDKESLKNISFNYPRTESDLSQINSDYFDNCTKVNSVSTFYSDIHSSRTSNEVWKYFIIATLLFLILELLIQKFVK